MAKIRDLPKVKEELVVNSSLYYLEYLNLLMNNLKIEATNDEAISYEVDHLDGITFVDIMEPDTLQYVEPK